MRSTTTILLTLAALLALPVLAADTASVVFESTREEAADGTVVWSSVVGDLDDETALRVGRPWSYLHEDVSYREEGWSYSRDGVSTVYGYRVVAVPNPSPLAKESPEGPPEVTADLAAELADGDPTVAIPLTVEVRGMPEWDVPLRPVPFTLSALDLAAAEERRRVALDARRELGSTLLDPVAKLIERLDGEVVARGSLGGWLTARVPAGSVRVLMASEEIKRMSLLRGRVEEHGPSLGRLRSDSFIDARQFLDAGYTGEAPNPARHAYGDITVGVVEAGQLEDDNCFVYDGAGCSGTSRLRAMYRCDDFDRDGNYCEPVSRFRDNDESANHGTLVTSVILGDYTQGQGDPYALGDDNWTPSFGHSSTWASEATGIAREASVVFFGQVADNDTDDGTETSAGFADAFDDAIDLGVDITNSSWGWSGNGATSCSLTAVGPHELEAENAFDDGILMVTSAGNPNTPVCAGAPAVTCSVSSDCAAGTGPCVAASSACNIGSPADLPKTLAVNALNAAEPSCESAYSSCLTDPNFSANGGIDAEYNGATCAGCITGISLTAPDRFCQGTSALGLHGTVGSCFAGTSASSPVVAGAAALVKDQYLSNGQAFINSPGRLHTVMLAMGDRNHHTWGATSSTQQIVNASPLMGAGRLKMRLLENGAGMDPWGNHVAVVPFAAPGVDFVYHPWIDLLPAGTNLVKCVAYSVEDMSSKSDISRVDLEVRLYQTSANYCGSLGPLTYTRIDAGAEIKHISAITSSDTTLANRCVEVTLEPNHITNSGVTVIANCYYSGVEDEFSAPD